MQKKEDNTKKSKAHNWTLVIVVLIISAVFLVISNDFSSLTGSAVRIQKKPDLVATLVNLQDDVDRRFAEDGTLLYHLQVGATLANFGNARAKESVFRVGLKSDNLENVGTSVSYLDATGKLILSATTKFITMTNYNSEYVDINIDPLMPVSGTGKSYDSYTILFMRVPVNLPPPDGTVSETPFTFYSQADVASVISESNETNNYKENSYIFRCAYLNYPNNPYPSCCIHRVDPLSTTYTNIRGNYCEDYAPYEVLYLPP